MPNNDDDGIGSDRSDGKRPQAYVRISHHSQQIADIMKTTALLSANTILLLHKDLFEKRTVNSSFILLLLLLLFNTIYVYI